MNLKNLSHSKLTSCSLKPSLRSGNDQVKTVLGYDNTGIIENDYRTASGIIIIEGRDILRSYGLKALLFRVTDKLGGHVREKKLEFLKSNT